MAQQYTSERTCRNQLPALHRALLQAGVWQSGDTNADIGGGRFDKAVEELGRHGVENVWDPYNRSPEHNEASLRRVVQGTTTATVAKVLNVIAEPEVRAVVIRLAAKAGRAYFHVYEGDGSGVGKKTRDGWQEHRKLASYLPEIVECFGQARVVTLDGLRVIEAIPGT
jgi:hypothetical protein